MISLLIPLLVIHRHTDRPVLCVLKLDAHLKAAEQLSSLHDGDTVTDDVAARSNAGVLTLYYKVLCQIGCQPTEIQATQQHRWAKHYALADVGFGRTAIWHPYLELGNSRLSITDQLLAEMTLHLFRAC